MNSNILKTKYKGKDIEVTCLFRYVIDDLGNLTVTKRDIEECSHGHKPRIRFMKGTTVGYDTVNAVTNGKIVYLPVEDKDLAIKLLIENYERSIRFHERKAEEFKDKLEAFKELNVKEDN